VDEEEEEEEDTVSTSSDPTDKFVNVTSGDASFLFPFASSHGSCKLTSVYIV
jgi:hypothetical protein